MRYLKTLGAALFVAAVAVLGLGSAAQAATNGDHDQGFTCTTANGTGGSPTQVHMVFSYHTTGVGSPDINQIWGDQVVWSTSPAVDLDYLWIGMVDNGLGYPFWVGGSGSAQNDVNDHGTVVLPSDNHRNFDNGTPGVIRMLAIGGTSNYNGGCTVDHNSL